MSIDILMSSLKERVELLESQHSELEKAVARLLLRMNGISWCRLGIRPWT